jgi:hypothetical protein
VVGILVAADPTGLINAMAIIYQKKAVMIMKAGDRQGPAGSEVQ